MQRTNTTVTRGMVDKSRVAIVVGTLALAVQLTLVLTGNLITADGLVDGIGKIVLSLESAEVTLHRNFTFHFLDFITTLSTCKHYRRNVKKSPVVWGEAFVSCLILQFGGTSLVAFILGVPPWWAVGHASIVAYIISWWLVFCSPYDIVWKLFDTFPNADIPLTLLGAISSCHALTSWGMDRVIFNDMNHLDSTMLTKSTNFALLSGVVASSGGGLCGDLFNVLGTQTYQLRSVLFHNGPDGDRARDRIATNVFLCVCYLSMLNPAGLFPGPPALYNRAAAKQVLCVLCLMRWLLHTLWPDYHPIGGMCAVLLRICQVPHSFHFQQGTAPTASSLTPDSGPLPVPSRREKVH